jgi:hypothetical protein
VCNGEADCGEQKPRLVGIFLSVHHVAHDRMPSLAELTRIWCLRPVSSLTRKSERSLSACSTLSL